MFNVSPDKLRSVTEPRDANARNGTVCPNGKESSGEEMIRDILENLAGRPVFKASTLMLDAECHNFFDSIHCLLVVVHDSRVGFIQAATLMFFRLNQPETLSTFRYASLNSFSPRIGC